MFVEWWLQNLYQGKKRFNLFLDGFFLQFSIINSSSGWMEDALWRMLMFIFLLLLLGITDAMMPSWRYLIEILALQQKFDPRIGLSNLILFSSSTKNVMALTLANFLLFLLDSKNASTVTCPLKQSISVIVLLWILCLMVLFIWLWLIFMSQSCCKEIKLASRQYALGLKP